MHSQRGFCAFGSAFFLPAVLLTLLNSADPHALNDITGELGQILNLHERVSAESRSDCHAQRKHMKRYCKLHKTIYLQSSQFSVLLHD